MSWTSDQAKALADRILSFCSKATDCEVSLRLSQTGHTRFAANEITTAGMVRNVSVSITSREGGKSGSDHNRRDSTNHCFARPSPGARH